MWQKNLHKKVLIIEFWIFLSEQNTFFFSSSLRMCFQVLFDLWFHHPILFIHFTVPRPFHFKKFFSLITLLMAKCMRWDPRFDQNFRLYFFPLQRKLTKKIRPFFFCFLEKSFKWQDECVIAKVLFRETLKGQKKENKRRNLFCSGFIAEKNSSKFYPNNSKWKSVFEFVNFLFFWFFCWYFWCSPT